MTILKGRGSVVELPDAAPGSEPIRLEDLYEHLYGLRDAGKLSDDDVNLIIWAHVDPDDSPENAADCIRRRFRD